MSEPEPAQPATARKHILTISVEDYFHAGNFEGAVLRRHWDRFESRLEQNINDVLQLLARHDIHGTFFVLGWIGERQPELVAKIVAAGHEIATRGFWPRQLRGISPQELREELRRSKEALEAAGANRIVGYRSPRRWITERDLWVLDVLAEEGYLYDSSINPILRRFSHDPRRFEVHQHHHATKDLSIWEFPISTVGVLGIRVAISGGNYIRQIPHTLLKHTTAWWHEHREAPMVFYFMPWEFDREQPQITAISLLRKVRHYRNLAKTRWVLEDYLRKYRFQPIGAHLQIPWSEKPILETPSVRPIEVSGPTEERPAAGSLEPITIVIPLYNEEKILAYLQRTLRELRLRLGTRYALRFILVDDGSKDATWPEMNARFGGSEDCMLLRHPQNQGVAAAIRTGLQSASTEIVCSIDSDCSYDPMVLAEMIPLLSRADMVTTSPYHPQGHVFNVPRWRLFLSRTLSRLYSTILRERLFTFTSCCRVYRRSAMLDIPVSQGGFLGVAEMLIRLRKRGGTVVEYPATLESRLIGESKMRVLRTICSHLKLLAELTVKGGARGPRRAASPQPPPGAPQPPG